jgi:hypothetical protein
MSRRPAGLLAVLILLGTVAAVSAAKPDRPSKAELKADAVPEFPEAKVPASWGRLVAVIPAASSYQLAPSLIFEAQDGTIRRVEMMGSALSLEVVVRRSAD